MKKLRALNSLVLGELPSQVCGSPQDKGYGQGCEQVTGFDITPTGLVAMRTPAYSNLRPFVYLADSYRSRYYLSNTHVSGPTQSALPSESAATYRSLDAKVSEMVTNGDLRAAPSEVTDPNYLSARRTGIYRINRGPSAGVLIDGAASEANRTLIVSRKTRIFRAFWPMAEMAGGNAGADANAWGLHAKRHVYRRDYDTGWGGGVNDDHKHDDTYFGMAQGGAHAKRGECDKQWDEYHYAESEQWLDLLYVDLAPGVYTFPETLYLVGTGKMFKDSPNARSYKVEVTNYGATGTTTMSEDRAWCDEADYLVLAWGGEANIANPPSSTYQGGWGWPAPSKLEITGEVKFWFTGKTSIIGSRRFGPAVLEGDSELFGATMIGQMGGSDPTDSGRTIPASNIDAGSAYTVKVPGGVSWFEEVSGGVLIGTPSGEYLLENPQVNPATGGASLRKISAVGTSRVSGYKLSISANLAGSVYYSSKYGVTTLAFSTELQSYLPRNIEFMGRRAPDCDSIAASVAEKCLYFVSDGTLWKIWPETGALAEVPVSLPSGYVVSGVINRLGEVLVLAQDGTGADFYCAVSAVRAAVSYLRTTAFGRGPSGRAQVKKLILSCAGLKTGQFRIGGTGAWRAIPLSAQEQLSGFTGIKEIPVSDRPAPIGEGRFVEFQFDANQDEHLADPGMITALGVEMEV